MFDRVATVLTGLALGAVVAVFLRWRRRHGDPWRWRDRSFLIGVGLVAVTTIGPIDAAADTSFFFHSLQHLALGMVAPVLIVLGEPIKLALQTSGPSVRPRLRRLVRSTVVTRLSTGLVPVVPFGAGMVGLYLTPLYGVTGRLDWVHVLVHLHLLASGGLLAWAVLGDHPGGGDLGHPVRLLAVLALVPVHAVIGLTLLSQRTILTEPDVLAPFGWSAAADQQAGAVVLWVAGELVALAMAVLVLARWKAAEDRKAARLDRAAV